MQPFNETTLSEIQRKQFELMSEREKELVRKGHPTKIISTETGEEICSFNEHNFEVPKEALCDLSQRTKLPKAVILRHMIMNCEVIPAPKIDYETHIRELREVGNKFNDILLTARTKGFINPKEVQCACDELQIIEDKMKEEIHSIRQNRKEVM